MTDHVHRTVSPPASPRGWQVAVMAVRPRTLVLAVTPVLLGSTLGWSEVHAVHLPSLVLALACALLIQIATNLHNDAADHEQGTDRADRIGPPRVTASGWARPRTLMRAAVGCFAAALLLGLALVLRGGWPILIVGIASLAAGWSYSGGPRPISRTPWGELFVLVFFGVVAVCGSHWLQARQPSIDALIGGLALGLPAAAVLLVNNVRDLIGDVRAGRRTLASLLSRVAARRLYAALLLLPFGLSLVLVLRGHAGALLAVLALPPAWRCVRRFTDAPAGPWMNALLASTAQTAALLGVSLSAGLALR